MLCEIIKFNLLQYLIILRKQIEPGVAKHQKLDCVLKNKNIKKEKKIEKIYAMNYSFMF